MALFNQLEAEATTRTLAHWLAERIPAASDVRVSGVQMPSASGLSCETVLFDATWSSEGAVQPGAYVARVAPVAGTGLFPDYDLETEAALMRALHRHSDVPTPNVLWTERDPGLLNAPFIVMERIAGRVPEDDPTYAQEGWVLDLSAEAQRRMLESAVQTVAAVARVDWQRHGLGVLDRPQYGAAGLEQRIGFLRMLYETGNQGHAEPVLETALGWLRDNAPAGEPLALSWGDARIGNMLFGDGERVVGALDWELACLCSPEADLGYFLYALRLWSEGHGVPSPAGFPGREEIVDAWQRHTGLAARHVDYYERLGATFGAIAVMRGMYLMMDAGLLPADSALPTTNPASIMLADYLGLAPPSGPVGDWIGHR